MTTFQTPRPCFAQSRKRVPSASLPSPQLGAMLKLNNSLKRRRNSIEVFDGKHALDLATAQTYSENVFLFVPNLIGEFPRLPQAKIGR
jgi:hypothetical protein